MVRFALPRVRFHVELHVELQRDMQPYPSSHVAVWKTGQGREKLWPGPEGERHVGEHSGGVQRRQRRAARPCEYSLDGHRPNLCFRSAIVFHFG